MSKKTISRRTFFKTAGLAGLASAGLTAACVGRKDSADAGASGEIPTDAMTYRQSPSTGDRVSLLGFGMMRLPLVPNDKDDQSGDIDQELVNELVDYALAHGVNYFDTSPAYCKGRSETATGIALSRHPRDKYYIATKLSNFDPSTWSREASIAMYRESMRCLQVDYIDYMLLLSLIHI